MSLNHPESLRYTEEHEWIDPESGWMGISDYAQQQLGDIVFVDLPEKGTKTVKGEELLVVESVKSVSDVYAPANGVVEEVNSELVDSPGNINQDPYQAGRLVRLAPDSIPDDLMTADEYEDFVS